MLGYCLVWSQCNALVVIGHNSRGFAPVHGLDVGLAFGAVGLGGVLKLKGVYNHDINCWCFWCLTTALPLVRGKAGNESGCKK